LAFLGMGALACGFVAGLQMMPAGSAVSEASRAQNFDQGLGGSQVATDNRRWQLASLESVPFTLPAEGRPAVPARTEGVTLLVEEPATDSYMPPFDLYVPSFNSHFASLVGGSGLRPTIDTEEREALPQPAPNRDGHAAPRRAVAQLAPPPPLPSISPAKKQLRIAEAVELSPDTDAHTAIYDISAHRVYLPDGRQLEAHSGLGNRLDDVRYVSERGRGPTPPNVYDLSMREESFHGVRALRLNPIGSGTMYGRDGLLVHPYMLGPYGESNGCVSVDNYNAFLNAYLSGEVNRLVVVDHLTTPPPASMTAFRWIPEKIFAFFGHS
jgi:hypothetical protein